MGFLVQTSIGKERSTLTCIMGHSRKTHTATHHMKLLNTTDKKITLKDLKEEKKSHR